MVDSPRLVLSFDPGRIKTGVALGNTMTRDARPLATVRGNLAVQLEKSLALCSKWGPSQLVVGSPGAATAAAAERYCRKFGTMLSDQTSLPVVYVDEHMSTQAARSTRNSAVTGVDAIAACLIAQDWLSRQTKYQ